MDYVEYHTYYAKTDRGYEIVDEVATVHSLGDGEYFPEDFWISETHQVSFVALENYYV